jgi:lipid II:glycine glycyltransferase (peptidoglycan interpeptide bridge formation enzyme)
MSKDLYRTICKAEDDIPVFSRDWWLDAACGDDWDVLLYEKNGKVYAAMPLYIPCQHIISMPHYTQTMGVWFAKEAADTKYSSQLANRQAICNHFTEQIKHYKHFFQNFSHEFTDWLPFYWTGYSQTTRYTYILRRIKEFDRIWSEMSQQTRRNIKKAQESPVRVQRDISVDSFLTLQTMTFERQNQKKEQSDAVLQRLIKAARERNQGDIFGGYDEKGRLHAAAFIVWQNSCAYYIAGGGDPALRSSGAHSLVMWHAIQHVSRFTDTFDFEGSMLPGVERFFREFAAVQTPYFAIMRGKPGLLNRIRMKFND